MSIREAVFYVGWMIGVAIVYQINLLLGYPRWVGIVGGLVIGAGLGYSLEKIFSSFKGNDDQPS